MQTEDSHLKCIKHKGRKVGRNRGLRRRLTDYGEEDRRHNWMARNEEGMQKGER